MDVDQPVVDYAASMGFAYTVPSPAEASQRREAAREAYQDFVQKARTAMAAKDFAAAADNYLHASYFTGNMTLDDRVAAARAVALSKHKNARTGLSFLFQAVLLGYDAPQNLLNDKDFASLKTASPNNWNEFAAMVSRLDKER